MSKICRQASGLASFFTGGSHYTQQNYQDTLALCRKYGHLDFFTTFTCNSKWSEIQHFLDFIPCQKPEDRHDIVCRVFKMKLNELMHDIRKYSIISKVRLNTSNEDFHMAYLDMAFSTKIPDEKEDPIGYNAMKQFMMHGPCGDSRSHNSETYVEKNGYPVYKRRDDGREIMGKEIPLDNRNMRLQKKTLQNYREMSVEEFDK
ncbi:hypothetical protein RJ639_028378 [Escallonia herrerae]|uniref:Helitron helicase-like domain-containing protein n=1 Tax=Escallonia herrerae TaxID=1293975 RepID=A0AA89BL56_9ASTE|nr:hypothetical protein RJ639_028378 [Escallonia herrerae]